jgi:hypothetical protein
MSEFGYDGSFGLGRETVWGTSPAAPEIQLEIEEESLSLKQETIAKPTIPGYMEQHHIPGHKTVEGSVSFPLNYDEAYFPMLAVMGAVDTNDAGDYNIHTLTLSADTNTPGLSAYVDRDGQDFVYSGLAVNSAKFTQEPEDFLKVSLDLVGKDESLTSFTETTYADFYGVAYDDLEVKVGGTVLPVSSVEFTVEKGVATDRFQLGSRTRRGLGRGSLTKVSGTLKTEYDSNESSAPYTKFRNQTEAAIIMTWTGPEAVTGVNKSLVITFPRAIFQGTTPPLKGQGVVELELPFTAYASENGVTGSMTAVLTTTDGE